MARRVERFKSYWSLFNHREAGSPSDPENGLLRAKTGAGLVPVAADSSPVTGVLGCHELSTYVPVPFILRVSNVTGFVRRYK